MSETQTERLALIYGKPLLTKIKSTLVLVAGVGGVGSELIKNLIFAGFGYLTLIDFDVVDMSNLNRNLYFKTEHALQKKPKVEAVCENIKERFPHLKLSCYNKSIMDFEPDFFRKFDIVFCAVDDKEAREFLGRMCIIADKIMIESGTQGFAGQVKTQIRGLYACNYCRVVKNYEEAPGCSVRAIPTQPVHAVMWAKDLFDKLFNRKEDFDVCKFLEQGHNSNEEYEKIGKVLFNKYFYEDVQKLQNNDILESRGGVFPLLYEEALKQRSQESLTENGNYLESQKIWTPAQCAENFIEYFKKCLQKKIKEMNEVILLDKDDLVLVGFVCAATNLRIYNFLNSKDYSSKLKYISLFEIKEKIATIIPTITSANSTVSGIQVTEAIKCIDNDLGSLRRIWLSSFTQNKLTDTPNNPPVIDCEVCSFRNIYINLEIRPETSLRQLKEFFEDYYHVTAPRISTPHILFDSEEDDEEMAKIYKRNLDLELIKLLRKKNSDLGDDDVKTSIMITNLTEPFLFHCWIHFNEVKTPIMPNEDSRRDKVLGQQKKYLQQVQEENRKKMMKLYAKHIF